MLKLNVEKGHQVIKLPQRVAILRYSIATYSGYRAHGVSALQSSSYTIAMSGIIHERWAFKPFTSWFKMPTSEVNAVPR